MENCIFCKIVNNEIPSIKIYEDNEVLAFLDINPNNFGHSLVIPKDHFENIYTTPNEALCRIIMICRKISLAVKEATSADGINIEMNNEKASGQEVFHTHFHIIPRFENDGFKHFPTKKYPQGEDIIVAEKIKNSLSK